MKKTAIITGCAKGIGREIALELARDGYNIIGTCNNSLQEMYILKNKIEAIGVKFYSYKVNFLNDEEVIGFINNIKKEFNNIDVLVNNAALALDNNFKDKKMEEFQAVLQVNLITPFVLIQKLCDLMKNGVIINISSTNGINTYTKLDMDYSASKAGVVGITKTVAKELAGRGVTCNAIAPGFIETDMTDKLSDKVKEAAVASIPMRKMGTPSDIAHMATFLASDKAAYITGEVIRVDGGIAM